MTEAATILVVDDDERLRQLLTKYLEDSGFKVKNAASAREARERLTSTDHFDLMVLDIMMPGESGLELADSLRSHGSHLPILMLTAMDQPEERIAGLERGADDYLTKPFEPRELILRIQKLIGRQPVTSRPRETTAAFGPFRFDPASQRLTKNGAPVHLTSGEANLLQALAENLGMVMSRDALSERLHVPASERTIDVQITRLRKKIEADPRRPVYLQTIRHQGYVLRKE